MMQWEPYQTFLDLNLVSRGKILVIIQLAESTDVRVLHIIYKH
jgi:hypothetical protein